MSTSLVPPAPPPPTDLRVHAQLQGTQVRVVFSLGTAPPRPFDPKGLPGDGTVIIDQAGGVWCAWTIELFDVNRLLRMATFELTSAPMAHGVELRRRHIYKGVAAALAGLLQLARSRS